MISLKAPICFEPALSTSGTIRHAHRYDCHVPASAVSGHHIDPHITNATTATSSTTVNHALRGALMPAVEAATVAACVLSLFGGACAQAAAQIGGAPPKASLVYL